MSGQESSFDVVVAGAGIGGICAAVAAARQGVRVLLVEKDNAIGGTGVHSPMILICIYRDKISSRPINVGLHRELFPHIYSQNCGDLPTYDERDLARRYSEIISAEPTLTVWTGTEVVEVDRVAETIRRVRLRRGVRSSGPLPMPAVRDSEEPNLSVVDPALRSTSEPACGVLKSIPKDFYETWITAKGFIDSTADGNLGALAGAEYQKGRQTDGAMQPATLTFKVTGVDWRSFKVGVPFTSLRTWDDWVQVQNELEPYYQSLRSSGKTSNPRENVLCFAYPDNQSLLFNQTRLLGVDPTDPASMAAGRVEGEKQIREFWEAVRQHPAFKNARIEFVSTKLGVREGRRIVGDYILTQEDCLGEARFDDMVAACANPVDIHNPHGSGGTMLAIPGSGYYHIPYRCLRARGLKNLLMGSRCISGTHEAHSSYRVMVCLSAIGQAAGTAAGLAVRLGKLDVRDITAAQIRQVLRAAGQFVEGECTECV